MAVLFLFAAAAAAAQSAPVPPPAAPDSQISRPPGKPFMSPMGEPFLGGASGEDGLTLWFEQADSNHDGSITRDEMTADAQRFFETLDANHDGEIDPDETAHYEQEIAPEVRTGLLAVSASDDAGGQASGQHGRGKHYRAGADFASGFSGGDDETRAGRFGLLQIPEPITSADSDFNRGVSAAEFQHAAVQRFQLLDINRTGRLVLSELQGIRGSAISASRRNPRGKGEQPAIDANDDTLAPPQRR